MGNVLWKQLLLNCYAGIWKYPCCKCWFQISNISLIAYHSFLFFLHLHHQIPCLKNFWNLGQLIGLLKRKPIIFAPWLQNIFIPRFVNVSWHGQSNEYFSFSCHVFPFSPPSSTCQIAIYWWTIWSKFYHINITINEWILVQALLAKCCGPRCWKILHDVAPFLLNDLSDENAILFVLRNLLFVNQFLNMRKIHLHYIPLKTYSLKFCFHG